MRANMLTRSDFYSVSAEIVRGAGGALLTKDIRQFSQSAHLYARFGAGMSTKFTKEELDEIAWAVAGTALDFHYTGGFSSLIVNAVKPRLQIILENAHVTIDKAAARKLLTLWKRLELVE